MPGPLAPSRGMADRLHRAILHAYDTLYRESGIDPAGHMTVVVHPDTRNAVLTEMAPDLYPHTYGRESLWGFHIATDPSVPPGEAKCVLRHVVTVGL